MLLIFALSSVANPPSLPDGTDKQLHAALYAGLGALLVRAIGGGWGQHVTRTTVALAVVIAACYGVTDEIHQHFVPPRQVEALDVVADTIGAAIASLSLYAWSRRRSDSQESGPV